MNVSDFINVINTNFFTGVPDSLLSPLADYLTDTYGTNYKSHIIAANEGNAMGLAAGYYLSTGQVPMIYMQNSGEGNIVNPITSLFHQQVYAIPAILVIGWRGQPGVQDEPQHVFMGQVTNKLIEDMGISCFIINKDTTITELRNVFDGFQSTLKKGGQICFIVEKGGLVYDKPVVYKNSYLLNREEALGHVIEKSGMDVVVATTGKISREIYEIRTSRGIGHERDFLCVGSMGHASSIALGIAMEKSDRVVWIIDGDGACIMHMGAMATIGKVNPNNLIHVVMNNEAHESVGGLPTSADAINFCDIARACGYKMVFSVDNIKELRDTLNKISDKGPVFLEVKCSIGSRGDLGRPKESPIENKIKFMEYLSEDCAINSHIQHA